MKIVDISKHYLKGNVPSTVDVLRVDKQNKQLKAD